MEGLKSVKGIKAIYKEDMSDLNKCDVASIKYIQKLGSRDMELVVPRNQEIVNIDGRYILRDKKPQYPKTYEECEASGFSSNPVIVAQAQGVCLCSFAKLIVLRNAYWKIAGEEMGLDKPWEPDWGENDGEYRYCIHNQSNKIELCTINWLGKNYILSFPTEEMRDEFYNNFKELIEECKELL